MDTTGSRNMQAAYNRNATAIAALRIFVGIFFLLFGEYKVFGTAFTLHGGFEEWIRAFLAQGVYPWMAPVLRDVVLPHARVCAFLAGYGELLIGLGLTFGVLTRAASIFGILLMLLLWLSAGYPGPHVALWRYFGASLEWSVFAGCFAAFLIGEPEARWSLAARWKARRGRAAD
ncbi:MAG TPA: DoxX family membrane protein [Acidobacteriaceae bacterium]|nr:DoxX family membrane protein [Acidobacteriaceae bacterium]